ncbi:MAG: hypothetical protein ACFFEN_01055 [Candidatus Thorarchaeota archaeon]
MFGYTFKFIRVFYNFIFIFYGLLVGFTFLLFVLSFFLSIEKLKYYYIITIFMISIPIVMIFKGFFNLSYFFFLIVNQAFTGFFAFKLCMDSSTKSDNFLYKRINSRKFTRPLEFVFLGCLAFLFFIFTWNIFSRLAPIAAQRSANIFRIIFWVDLVLIIIVIIRLVITKKLAAYISLFFILTFFYVLYILIDIMAAFLFPDTLSYAWYFFAIDFALFFYIIGSIFDKVEYIEQKLKIIKPETISFFVILMKLIAQFFKIIPNIPGVEVSPTYLLWTQTLLLFIFLGCILLFGIHSIFFHKERIDEKERLSF